MSLDQKRARVFGVLYLITFVTSIAALALFQFGSGPVKGFAVTLGLGVFTNMFTAKINELTWQVWVPILMIFGIITAKSYAYHFNPLLGIMGWHFYKVSTAGGVTYVLITKKQLRRAAEEMQVGQLTEYILIDLGDKKA